MSVPMKDSGVAWLGKTPAHWGVVQSRRLFGERNEKARPNDQQLTVSQKYGLLSQRQFMELEGRRIVVVQKGQDILKRTMPGDFVISMRSFQGGLEFSEHEGSVSSAYVPITPIKWVVPRYFRWAFKSVTYIQALQATSDLVRDGQALRFENFAKVPLPIVPEDEQAAIADLLDRATSRIDTLIAKKTRFIELLREKREALITHVVTKGVDAVVSMKDSGVAWLGKMPAHWDVKPLWWAYRPKKDTGHPQETLLSVYRDYGVIEKSSRDDNRNRESEDLSGYQLVVNGDLVTNKMKTWQGSIAVSSIQGIVSPAYYVYRKLHSGNDAYFHHLFRSVPYITGYQSISKGIRVGQWDLEADKFRLFPVLIPPRPEQDAIVSHLDRATARIDTLVAKTERSIELLREHRIALITAAVTGRIDLRKAV
jgi:type I restriction enzyme, S subunit